MYMYINTYESIHTKWLTVAISKEEIGLEWAIIRDNRIFIPSDFFPSV